MRGNMEQKYPLLHKMGKMMSEAEDGVVALAFFV